MHACKLKMYVKKPGQADRTLRTGVHCPSLRGFVIVALRTQRATLKAAAGSLLGPHHDRHRLVMLTPFSPPLSHSLSHTNTHSHATLCTAHLNPVGCPQKLHYIACLCLIQYIALHFHTPNQSPVSCWLWICVSLENNTTDYGCVSYILLLKPPTKIRSISSYIFGDDFLVFPCPTFNPLLLNPR